jgi:TRAP-type mannitol/chloroaromatic compound transport system substrate-binding protein
MIQASYQWGGFYSPIIPIGDIDAGVPMLSTKETGVMQRLWYERGLLNLVREAYAKHNIFFLAPNFFPDPYSYAFGGDVRNLEGFKGKKVRAVGMWTDLTKELGAAPATVPYAEIYQALKLGTVDGTVTCTVSGMMEYKHWEVVKSYFLPSLYYLADNITLNMDAWKALPKDIRDLLEEHTRYHFADWTNRTQWMATLAEQKAKEIGVKFHNYTPEEWETIKSKFMTVFDKLAQRDEYCAKAVPLVKDTLKEAGLLK